MKMPSDIWGWLEQANLTLNTLLAEPANIAEKCVLVVISVVACSLIVNLIGKINQTKHASLATSLMVTIAGFTLTLAAMVVANSALAESANTTTRAGAQAGAAVAVWLLLMPLLMRGLQESRLLPSLLAWVLGLVTASAAVMITSGLLQLGSWVGDTSRDREEQREETQKEIEAFGN